MGEWLVSLLLAGDGHCRSELERIPDVRREHGWDRTLGALPKAMAAQSCWKIATWTMELHGGHGYMKEFGVEKLMRDAAAFLHSDGVNRTLFLKAANFMFAD